jgi:hypothetical protein
MPIRDRSNRRLIRLGFIRLGHKEKGTRQDGSTYEYPVQDDHFLLHDAPEVKKFYDECGIPEVRELDVLLPFPDIERNFPTWYQVWAGGVLVCQGDGEYVSHATPFTASVFKTKKGEERTSVKNARGNTLVANDVAQVAFDWGDKHFGEGEHVPCPGKAQGLYPHCAACSLSSVLKVMMADPELFRFGYYQISTGSGRNYETIMGTLETMPADRVNGFPFKLRLVEEPTSYVDKDGQRHKTSRHFLKLEPDPKTVRRLLLEAPQRYGEPVQLASVTAYAPSGELPFDEPPYGEGLDDDPFLREGDYRGHPEDPDAREDRVEEQEKETLLDEAVAPEQSELDYVPEWIDTNRKRQRGKLWFEAREHLGYESDLHCERTLEKLVEDADERAKLSYRAVWHLLQEHQRSKVG